MRQVVLGGHIKEHVNQRENPMTIHFSSVPKKTRIDLPDTCVPYIFFILAEAKHQLDSKKRSHRYRMLGPVNGEVTVLLGLQLPSDPVRSHLSQ
jgi:hypothetical protein